MAISILSIILLVLMTLVGGKSGLLAFISLVVNFIILFITVILISAGFPAIWVAFFAGLCLLAVIIYMGNSDELTTNIAFQATLIVSLIMLGLIIPVNYFAHVQGFSPEQSPEIEAFNILVGVNFKAVVIATTFLSTLGAIAEASVAIVNGMQEVAQVHPELSYQELLASGRQIALQIIGMTFNTLFFGMFGGDLALFVLLYKLNAQVGYYLNSKIFVGECLRIIYAAIAVILVIWLAIHLTARRLKPQKKP